MNEHDYIIFKNKYETETNKKINDNTEKLINSFVDYYGEEYREIITNRIKKINYLYYVSDIFIFYTLDKAITESKENKKIEFSNLIGLSLYMYKNNLYKVKLTPDNFYELQKKIIGVSNKRIINDKTLLKYSIALANRENSNDPYEFNLKTNKNTIERIVSLPIYSIDDKDLIHEINHAVCSNIDNNGKIKCGLSDEDDKKTSRIKELVNDISSIEIYKIFNEKYNGLIFEENIMKHLFYNDYEIDEKIFLPIFNEYSGVIKKSNISNDLTYLFDTIGKENFNYLCEIFNSKESKEIKKSKVEELLTIKKLK